MMTINDLLKNWDNFKNKQTFVASALRLMADFIEQEPAVLDDYAEDFINFLKFMEMLESDDCFGTEGARL